MLCSWKKKFWKGWSHRNERLRSNWIFGEGWFICLKYNLIVNPFEMIPLQFMGSTAYQEETEIHILCEGGTQKGKKQTNIKKFHLSPKPKKKSLLAHGVHRDRGQNHRKIRAVTILVVQYLESPHHEDETGINAFFGLVQVCLRLPGPMGKRPVETCRLGKRGVLGKMT